VLFLLSGLCTTLGTQWIFYNGAASKVAIVTNETSLFQY
jgi:hypothetical protein